MNRHASPPRDTGITVDGREGIPEGVGVQKQTMTHQNRAACIGDNEIVDRNDFDHNVQKVMGMRSTGNYLNARVIESWINETLNDAEKLEIPGVVVKPQ